MRTQKGFTLIETMIVVTVAGVLLAIGVPAFGSYRNTLALKQATTQVQNDIERARQLAITRRAPVYVRFGTAPAADTTNITHYWIHIDTDNDQVVDATESRKRYDLPATTQLTSVAVNPRDTVAFDISGILIPSHTGGRLVLVNALNRRDSLMVSAAGIVYKP